MSTPTSPGITDLIPSLLDAFDFERVAKTMAALDWRNTREETSPSKERLLAMAESVLRSGAEDNDHETETHSGGFRAWQYQRKLHLQFVIETAYAEIGRASRL